ncbi:MAG: XTP/dITP diphosphatase [Acholeplasmatales bacterium]|nr:XTP/dITP diphosphatase [Acholeplasmatales bacterium]
MKTVVIATNNKNKVREFKSLLGNDNIEFKTLNEIGYTKEIIEDGNTFEENAYIKAHQVSKDLNVIAISDDSGLEVEALNMAPGIYSARYAGGHDDEANNNLLIKNLKGIENRKARYACAICICYPNGETKTVIEYCYGEIIDDRRGTNGFGYDPYFYIPEFGKTFAEVPLEKKNTISHRAKAIRKLKELLNEDFSLK